MQAPLALVGCAAGIVAGWQRSDLVLAVAAILLGAVVPFTLAIMLPTNKCSSNPTLDARSPAALALLVRWGRLHAVRSVLGGASFVIFLARALVHLSDPTDRASSVRLMAVLPCSMKPPTSSASVFGSKSVIQTRRQRSRPSGMTWNDAL